MSDIVELVIKMPKIEYEHLTNQNKFSSLEKNRQTWLINKTLNRVAEGTLLPEGHGKIIDVDDLDITTVVTDDFSGNEMLEVVLKEDIDDAHALIEADKPNDEQDKA